MALINFKFANTNENLNTLLNYALKDIVRSDFGLFDIPGMASNLDLLYSYRGLRYEDEVEFYLLPHGNGAKDAPVDFVVISDLLFNPGEAGLYAYNEFARGLYAELMRQSEGNEARREKAATLIQRYNLQEYADM
ncbi:hypothetical protein [Massilia rubra]|uniref:Uncharacterized protein n=1 Tax=Massilia rubra TaxID=2607910 RepID=A0ABX0LX96_9BURK|nr:hypothetical protein [Massilia rubra]NHZ36752.1 hypothetical protein [Massilia rubra]